MGSIHSKKVAAAVAAVLQHTSQAETTGARRSPGSAVGRKVAAAMATVLQHAAEAEGAVLPQVAAAAATPERAPGTPVAVRSPAALWGVAGRQDAMLDRTLWQRRISKTW
jgi:hypothetical protein